MSLIPRNTSNTPTPPFTPFTHDFWDSFFSFPFQYPFTPSSTPTLPHSDLSLQTTGDTRTRFECKEIPEAYLIVAELPGLGNDDVHVGSQDGRVVTVSGSGGQFSWRVGLPRGANVEMMSRSMENGVLTVVVPKFGSGSDFGSGLGSGSGGVRNVRVVEITGDDDE